MEQLLAYKGLRVVEAGADPAEGHWVGSSSFTLLSYHCLHMLQTMATQIDRRVESPRPGRPGRVSNQADTHARLSHSWLGKGSFSQPVCVSYNLLLLLLCLIIATTAEQSGVESPQGNQETDRCGHLATDWQTA